MPIPMTLLMILAPLFAGPPNLAETAVAWPNLLTWGGLIVLGFVSVIRGWLVPKSSHEREMNILKEQIATLNALMEKRVGDAITEKNEWRAASLADQAVAQETRAQHRLLLETQRSTTYALEQMRTGFEQVAAKDGQT